MGKTEQAATYLSIVSYQKQRLLPRLVEKMESSLSGIRLEDARVIVSGGRGLGML